MILMEEMFDGWNCVNYFIYIYVWCKLCNNLMLNIVVIILNDIKVYFYRDIKCKVLNKIN